MQSAEWTGRVHEEVRESLRQLRQSTTLLVTSGDMDRVFAALAMANAAAALGRSVTVYFAFWGVTVVRCPARVTGKTLLESAIAGMLPVGAGRLPLSRMNFGGLGAWFFRWWMKRKRIEPLEGLLSDARDLGVRLVVCEMSMEMMGLRREEMLAGVEFAGVTSFMKDAGESGVALFV